MTFWYLARAAGFAALVAATLSVTLGALASGRPEATLAGRDRRVLRQLAHRSAGVVTLAMLALHVVLLVTDRYVDLALPGVLVPFTAGYRAFAVGLGTLSLYGFLVVAVTGAARGRLASSERTSRSWRVVHASAYAVWALALGHGVLAGTDTGTWWAWALYGLCATAVVAALATRLLVRSIPAPAPLAAARRQLTSGGVR